MITLFYAENVYMTCSEANVEEYCTYNLILWLEERDLFTHCGGENKQTSELICCWQRFMKGLATNCTFPFCLCDNNLAGRHRPPLCQQELNLSGFPHRAATAARKRQIISHHKCQLFQCQCQRFKFLNLSGYLASCLLYSILQNVPFIFTLVPWCPVGWGHTPSLGPWPNGFLKLLKESVNTNRQRIRIKKTHTDKCLHCNLITVIGKHTLTQTICYT